MCHILASVYPGELLWGGGFTRSRCSLAGVVYCGLTSSMVVGSKVINALSALLCGKKWFDSLCSPSGEFSPDVSKLTTAPSGAS